MQVGTKKEYVAKVKCEYKKALRNYGEIHVPEALRETSSNGGNSAANSIALGQASDAAAKNRQEGRATIRGRGRPITDPYRAGTTAAFQDLSNDERKSVWTAFDSGKTRVDVIKEYGLDPRVVRREYEDFLEFQGINLPEMQGVVIRKINEYKDHLIDGPLKHRKDEYEKIVAEYNDRTYVGTKQFLAVLDIYMQLAKILGKESIADLSESLPHGWIRPNCAQCGKPLDGILYETSFWYGQPYIEEVTASSKYWMHFKCSRSYTGF